MNYTYINESAILERWSTTLDAAKIEGDKRRWLSVMLNNMDVNGVAGTLNEAAVVNPYSTVTNTVGIGAIQPPGAPAGLNQFINGQSGSADRYPNVFALAVQIAQKTIGFDLVNVLPLQMPAGQVAYFELNYADGQLDTATPPSVISIPGAVGNYVVGRAYFATSDDDLTVATGDVFLQLFYVGTSAIDGTPIFEVGQTKLQASVGAGPATTFTAAPNLRVIDALVGTAGGGSRIVAADAGNENLPAVTGATLVAASTGAVTGTAKLVDALENHVQGYTGSGRSNTDRMVGNWVNPGTRLTGGMERSVAEKSYGRNMSLQVYTKFIETVERFVTASVTRQQRMDLEKIQGIEIMSLLENALADQISQSISKEITELAFALGVTSAKEVELSQGGFSLNVTLDPAITTAGTVQYVGVDGNLVSLNVPGFISYGGLENLQSVQRRIASKVLMASNLITQRNRGRGGATFIVTNSHIATALQDSSQYSLAAITNNLSQNTGSLFAVGTLSGMTIYVDPYMPANDNRILVGRRGSDTEPGIKFMPYAMAESITIIPEGTMGLKTLLSSRYALYPLGVKPQVQYYTIHVRVGNNIII